MKYIPHIHGVKSPPKAPVILNEDLNEANAPLIGALINCKRPGNRRIAPGLGGGFTLTGALLYNTSQCKLPPPPTQKLAVFTSQHCIIKIGGMCKYLVLSEGLFI